MVLLHNQSFETFSDFKAQLHQWALSDNFAIKIAQSDRSRCVIKCRQAADCHFRVRSTWGPEQERVVITALNPIHTTCLGAAPVLSASCSQFTYLWEAVPKILAITGKTKPKKIQQAMQLHHKVCISYAVSHKVLQYLQGQDIGLIRAQFWLLPLYIQKLHEIGEAGHFHPSAFSERRRFQRLFISPSASSHLFQRFPKLIAADGTLTKSKFH